PSSKDIYRLIGETNSGCTGWNSVELALDMYMNNKAKILSELNDELYNRFFNRTAAAVRCINKPTGVNALRVGTVDKKKVAEVPELAQTVNELLEKLRLWAADANQTAGIKELADKLADMTTQNEDEKWQFLCRSNAAYGYMAIGDMDKAALCGYGIDKVESGLLKTVDVSIASLYQSLSRLYYIRQHQADTVLDPLGYDTIFERYQKLQKK
ncbi:MAG TPA: hypothetical protein VIQ97_03115, partial [Prevotella sp.]